MPLPVFTQNIIAYDMIERMYEKYNTLHHLLYSIDLTSLTAKHAQFNL
jgi:hypothetical protein